MVGDTVPGVSLYVITVPRESDRAALMEQLVLPACLFVDLQTKLSLLKDYDNSMLLDLYLLCIQDLVWHKRQLDETRKICSNAA